MAIDRDQTMTDKERLDFLQQLKAPPGHGWRIRESSTGRGWRLITTTSPQIFSSVREAIDYAVGRLEGPNTQPEMLVEIFKQSRFFAPKENF